MATVTIEISDVESSTGVPTIRFAVRSEPKASGNPDEWSHAQRVGQQLAELVLGQSASVIDLKTIPKG